MKMQQNSRVRTTTQSGFTLIELIVVIVILGILAATALPKFADLGNDARVAGLNAARASLLTTSSMAHGKFLANATATPVSTVTFEGTAMTLDTTSGYPVAATAGVAAAAGLTGSDYLLVAPGNSAGTGTTAGFTGPDTDANTIAIVPISVSGTSAAGTCFIKYTTSSTKNTPPTITTTPAPGSC